MSFYRSNQDPDLTCIAEEIKQYLTKHPQAADTLDGVLNWWLLRQRYEVAMDLVEKALEMLVQQDVLIKIKPRGCGTIYKMKKDI